MRPRREPREGRNLNYSQDQQMEGGGGGWTPSSSSSSRLFLKVKKRSSKWSPNEYCASLMDMKI